MRVKESLEGGFYFACGEWAARTLRNLLRRVAVLLIQVVRDRRQLRVGKVAAGLLEHVVDV